jgi:hypothetical protein
MKFRIFFLYVSVLIPILRVCIELFSYVHDMQIWGVNGEGMGWNGKSPLSIMPKDLFIWLEGEELEKLIR